MTVEQVKAGIETIAADRARMVSARISLDQRLETARREMGEKYLRGDRSHLKEVSALTVELEALERALGVLDEQEATANVELERAKARELREKAAAVRQELAELNQKTAPLLEQLSALEGVPYTRSILSSQPLPGGWYAPTGGSAEDLGILDLGMNDPRRLIGTPRSRVLLKEAEQLEAEARQIEQKLQ